jgi:hypothetical protein
MVGYFVGDFRELPSEGDLEVFVPLTKGTLVV